MAAPAPGQLRSLRGGGDQALVLQADVPLRISIADSSFVGEAIVRPRERRHFSIVSQAPEELRFEPFSGATLDRALEATIDWWRHWVEKGSYDETYPREVRQSALVLKLLTCAPTMARSCAATGSTRQATA